MSAADRDRDQSRSTDPRQSAGNGGRPKANKRGKGADSERRKLHLESLEDRILLSATWADADSADPTVETAGDADPETEAAELNLLGDAPADGDGGGDPFAGMERGETGAEVGTESSGADGADGEADPAGEAGSEPTRVVIEAGEGDDTIAIDDPQPGMTYVVEAGGGTDSLDLSSFEAGDVTFREGGLTVETAGGSFDVEFGGLETIELGDATAQLIEGGASGSVADGSSDIYVSGSNAFRIGVGGGGEMNFAYEASSGELTVYDGEGTGAGTSVQIESFGEGGNLSVGSVHIDGGVGSLTSDVDVERVTVAEDAAVSSITVGEGGGGSIGHLDFQGSDPASESVEVNASVERITARDFEMNMTVNGDVGLVDIHDDLNNGNVLTVNGDLGELRVADDVKEGAGVVVNGDAGVISVGDEVDSGSPITVNGSLSELEVNQKFEGVLTVSGDAGDVSFKEAVGGTVSVGGDLGSLRVTESMSQTVTVGGNAGSIEAARFTGGSISVSGGLDSISATADDSSGDLKAQLHVCGSLGSLNVGDDVHSAVVIDGSAGTLTIGDDVREGSSITVGGDMNALKAGGDVASSVSVSGNVGTLNAERLTGHVTVSGDVGTVTATNDARSGSLSVGGNLGEYEVANGSGKDISVSGNAERIAAGVFSGGSVSVEGDLDSIEATAAGSSGDLRASLRVRGDLNAMTIGDDVQAPITVGGDAGEIVVNDDLRDGGSLNVGGSLASYTSGGTLEGPLTVGGDTGEVSVDTLTGSATFGGSVSSIAVANDAVGANVSVTGDLGGLTAGDRVDMNLTVGGDAGDLSAGKFTGGNLTIEGNVGAISATASGASGDIRANVNVGGNAGHISAGDDIQGHINVRGDAASVRAGDDFRSGASVTIGGDAGEVSGDKIEAHVNVGGDIDTFSAGDFRGVLDAQHVTGEFNLADGDFTVNETYVNAHVRYEGGSETFSADETGEPAPIDEPADETPPTDEATDDEAPVIVLEVANASGVEDTPIALDISASVTGAESEDVTVTIGGAPDGTTLSSGVGNGDGTWTLRPEEAEGLTLTPPADFAGEFELTVRVEATGAAAPAPEAITFEADSVGSYGGGQDRDGQFTVSEGGDELSLSGNTWKDIPFPYAVTENTVIEFEFRSTSEGEAHCIGFAQGDDTGGRDGRHAFKIHGTQDWGFGTMHESGNAEPYAGGGEWQSFQIDVGEFFTGEFDALTFVNDDDVRNSEADGSFRNVRVYEADAVGSGEPTTSESEATLRVEVANAADAPDLNASDSSGAEDTLIPLNVDVAAAAGDDADDLSVRIDGVPEGAALIADVPDTEMGRMELPSGGTVTVTFESEEAGFRNSFGFYRIDGETGEIRLPEMGWQNASADGSGGSLIGGESSFTFDTDPGEEVGFFLIANGDRANDFDSFGEGRFEFRDADGGPATLNSSSPSLVHVADDGTETTVRGRIYHSPAQSENTQLNADGIGHVRTTLDDDAGVVTMGFEDMFRGGDKDFDDIVFTMEIGEGNVPTERPDYTVERNEDGSWTVGKDALPHLSVQPPADFSGEMNLTVTATNTAGGADAVSTQQVRVDVAGVADAAELTTADASGSEDTAIELSIGAALTDVDGSESLEVTVAGVPSGAELSAGVNNGDGTWTLQGSDLDGLTITPPPDSDADFTLSVSASSVEADTGDVEIVERAIGVEVAAVADDPRLNVGPESEISFRVSGDHYKGDPKMRVLVNGERIGGAVTVTADHDAGEFQTVTIRGHFGGDGPQSVAVQYINDKWDGSEDTDRNLYVDYVEVNGERFESEGEGVRYDAQVGEMDGRERMAWRGTMEFDTSSAARPAIVTAEDVSVALPIDAASTDRDGSEALAVTVSNVPDGASLSAGVDNGDGTWSIDRSELDGLTFTPPEHFSGRIELTVEAIATDGEDTNSVSRTVAIDVTPVADAPVLTASDVAGYEDVPVALDVDAALVDLDGSETLAVTISGVPADATLSAGVDLGDGSWSLRPDELRGLTLNPPADFSGDVPLTISAVATDGDSVAEREIAFTARVTPLADVPELSVAQLNDVTSGGSYPLTISAALTDVDGSETLSVTVWGLHDGLTLSEGEQLPSGGWRLTPEQLETVQLNVPAGYERSGALLVSATATESDGTSAQTLGAIRFNAAPAPVDATPTPEPAEPPAADTPSEPPAVETPTPDDSTDDPDAPSESADEPEPDAYREIDWSDADEMAVLDAREGVDGLIREVDASLEQADEVDADGRAFADDDGVVDERVAEPSADAAPERELLAHVETAVRDAPSRDVAPEFDRPIAETRMDAEGDVTPASETPVGTPFASPDGLSDAQTEEAPEANSVGKGAILPKLWGLVRGLGGVRNDDESEHGNRRR